MDLGAAARWAGGALAGEDTVERTAALASTAMVGTSFGPGLLPRPGLDQALATGIVAATNHGLVMTSESACAALARRPVPSCSARWPRGRVNRCAGRRCARHAGGRRGSGWPERSWPAWRRPTRPWVAAGRA